MHQHLSRTAIVVALAFLGPAAAPLPAQDLPEHVRAALRHAQAAVRDLGRYQRGRDTAEEVERSTRTVKIDANGTLEISNVSGDITVTGSERRDIQLEVTKRARERDRAEAKRELDLVQVDVTERAGRVEVQTRYPRDARRLRVSVDYDVLVPLGVQVNAKSVSGDVRVKNVRGESRAETVSGNVTVGAAARLALAKSVSGNVEIASASSEMALTVASVSGNILAKGVKVRTLDAGSVSGDLLLSSVQCERATIRSVSGNLEYGGSLAKNGRYELKSHSGDVRLYLPVTMGFELEASSFSGDVRSELPLTLRGNDTAARGIGGRTGRRTGQALRGVFGDGSALLEVTTFSGNIVIVKR